MPDNEIFENLRAYYDVAPLIQESQEWLKGELDTLPVTHFQMEQDQVPLALTAMARALLGSLIAVQPQVWTSRNEVQADQFNQGFVFAVSTLLSLTPDEA